MFVLQILWIMLMALAKEGLRRMRNLPANIRVAFASLGRAWARVEWYRKILYVIFILLVIGCFCERKYKDTEFVRKRNIELQDFEKFLKKHFDTFTCDNYPYMPACHVTAIGDFLFEINNKKCYLGAEIRDEHPLYLPGLQLGAKCALPENMDCTYDILNVRTYISDLIVEVDSTSVENCTKFLSESEGNVAIYGLGKCGVSMNYYGKNPKLKMAYTTVVKSCNATLDCANAQRKFYNFTVGKRYKRKGLLLANYTGSYKSESCMQLCIDISICSGYAMSEESCSLFDNEGNNLRITDATMEIGEKSVWSMSYFDRDKYERNLESFDFYADRHWYDVSIKFDAYFISYVLLLVTVLMVIDLTRFAEHRFNRSVFYTMYYVYLLDTTIASDFEQIEYGPGYVMGLSIMIKLMATPIKCLSVGYIVYRCGDIIPRAPPPMNDFGASKLRALVRIIRQFLPGFLHRELSMITPIYLGLRECYLLLIKMCQLYIISTIHDINGVFLVMLSFGSQEIVNVIFIGQIICMAPLWVIAKIVRFIDDGYTTIMEKKVELIFLGTEIGGTPIEIVQSYFSFIVVTAGYGTYVGTLGVLFLFFEEYFVMLSLLWLHEEHVLISFASVLVMASWNGYSKKVSVSLAMLWCVFGLYVVQSIVYPLHQMLWSSVGCYYSYHRV